MQETKMIIDNRERNLELLEMLEQNGVIITFAQVPVGDYIISDRMCVERKTTSDFESSIMNYRLFEQAKRLHESFEKAIVIIEGDNVEARLNKNVLIGTMLKLYVEFNIQLMYSSNAEETAYILAKLAEKEQTKDSREPRLVGNKRAYNQYQWQLLILGSIPGVGPKLAKSLIRKFKTLKNVVLATPEELTEIEKIGKKKAEKIYEILNSEFRDNGEALVLQKTG